jgi:hypothetical protein
VIPTATALRVLLYVTQCICVLSTGTANVNKQYQNNILKKVNKQIQPVDISNGDGKGCFLCEE